MASIERVERQIRILSEWREKRERGGLSGAALSHTIEILAEYLDLLEEMNEQKEMQRSTSDPPR